LSLLLVILAFSAIAQQPATERTLFDFENADELKCWSNLELPDAKQKEPPVKVE
jgi:hypothetical protein